MPLIDDVRSFAHSFANEVLGSSHPDSSILKAHLQCALGRLREIEVLEPPTDLVTLLQELATIRHKAEQSGIRHRQDASGSYSKRLGNIAADAISDFVTGLFEQLETEAFEILSEDNYPMAIPKFSVAIHGTKVRLSLTTSLNQSEYDTHLAMHIDRCVQILNSSFPGKGYGLVSHFIAKAKDSLPELKIQMSGNRQSLTGFIESARRKDGPINWKLTPDERDLFALEMCEVIFPRDS